MKLVEVIPAIQTSYEVLEKTIDTITSWKKTVAVTKDTPGFIVNRVARPFYGEALRIYEEGIADFETIDTLVILISSSGNSKNILNCAKHCTTENIPFIILTGFDSLNEVRANYSTYAEIDMYVNSRSYGVVECVHQVFLH